VEHGGAGEQMLPGDPAIFGIRRVVEYNWHYGELYIIGIN
jgi:hypothetical protein